MRSSSRRRVSSCAVTAALVLAVLAVQAQALARGKPQCRPRCAKLQERFALVFEYELCAASEPLQAALEDHRVVPVDTDGVTLSTAAQCWYDWAKANNAPSTPLNDSLTHVVVPKSETIRLTPNQSMSFDFEPLRACLGAKRAEGLPPAHRDITLKALRDRNLVDKPANDVKPDDNLVSLASEQADKFLWTKPHAHAQTRDGGDANAAKVDFTSYVTRVAAITRDQCCRKDYLGAGYMLGYVLHAIQDLATHRGMTNEFHAYEMTRGNNPDWVYEERLQQSANWTAEVITAMQVADSECLREAAKQSAPQSDRGWNLVAEKFRRGRNKLLAGPDGGTVEMMKFLVPGYFAFSQPKEITWFTSANADAEAKRLALDAVRTELSRGCPGSP